MESFRAESEFDLRAPHSVGIVNVADVVVTPRPSCNWISAVVDGEETERVWTHGESVCDFLSPVSAYVHGCTGAW